MRTLVWIVLSYLAMVLFCSLAARIGPAHVLPDATIIVVVFLAMRREPTSVALAAATLGYLTGRAALAPTGLHELALVAVGIIVYLAAGSLSAGGTLFYALTCALAIMGYHVLLFALLVWRRGATGFASWTTAALLPSAFATFLLAALSHPFMLALERRLSQDRREGLTWR